MLLGVGIHVSVPTKSLGPPLEALLGEDGEMLLAEDGDALEPDDA